MTGDFEFQNANAIKADTSLDAIYPQTRLFRAMVWELRGFHKLLKTKKRHYDLSYKETQILEFYMSALADLGDYYLRLNHYHGPDPFVQMFVDNAGTLEFDDLSFLGIRFLSKDTLKKLKFFYKKHLYKNFSPPFTVFNDENGQRVADLRRVDARNRIYEGEHYRVILRGSAVNVYGEDWCLKNGRELNDFAHIHGIVFRASKLEERGVQFINIDGWCQANKMSNKIFSRWHTLIKIVEERRTQD